VRAEPPPVPVTRPEPTVTERATTPVTSYAGNVEVIEMDRMRKLIADHMVKSKATSAHVTSFAEADVTHIVQWRERIKKDFEKREGEKITFTPLFIEAIVRTLKKFPLLNSSVDGDKILIKKDINIGMATALTNGNLIVPVIKGADQLNLVGLTRQVNLMANNARNNRLKPDDTQGGTFTFTNVGTFGSLMGTPIISQPQVAILATGAIKKKPVVLETPEGDSIAIRHMMFISMSYDHRIIDGSLGATFLTAVVKELEAFDVNRDI
jgi:2-oxoglutarate dehydrogenase E2 component (dihydrolipoamide succinyltransferase)